MYNLAFWVFENVLLENIDTTYYDNIEFTSKLHDLSREKMKRPKKGKLLFK